MIEWEDSRQPSAEWCFLSSFDPATAVRCTSVGWLVHDGDDIKALAPNMGDIREENSVQVSGVIRIPTRCVLSVIALHEPDLTSSSDPGPSSRPVKEQRQQAT